MKLKNDRDLFVENILELFDLEREKIYTDLMRVADAGEYEDMRRELKYYFKKQ